MPPKKRNAFFVFMMEMQEREQKKGKSYSMAEMPGIASPIWEMMSKDEKAEYEKKAKGFNGEQTTAFSGRSDIKTCHGIDYSLVAQEQRREETKINKMKEHIQGIIQQATISQTLRHKTFYVIHINYFCESTTPNGDKQYAAAELALLDFSLEDGVKRGIHTFLKLENLPYGYTFEAQRHTTETHMLPLPPKTIGNATIAEAIQEVLAFIGTENDMCPPIYTIDKDIPVVQSVFRDVFAERTIPKVDVRIYSMSELLFHMKCHSLANYAEPPFPSVYLAESYLMRETFDYSEGLPCEFHVENDRVTHCSQTKVKGWIYSLIRSCAPDLGIEFIDGKHQPVNSLGALKFVDANAFFTPGRGRGRSLNTSETVKMEPLPNSADLPRLREFKQGRGRGNLL